MAHQGLGEDVPLGLSLVEGESKYDDLERQLAASKSRRSFCGGGPSGPRGEGKLHEAQR
jgi:hypothetical protein